MDRHIRDHIEYPKSMPAVSEAPSGIIDPLYSVATEMIDEL